ncbi:hypothetical protein ABZ876_12505 [Streptomyces sp. NPDC046931]|uniref:hypothetical protein n=1 Tax=Streptomyces sp. NPDC046931 TaxID=3154806 RepID=UPI0033F49725
MWPLVVLVLGAMAYDVGLRAHPQRRLAALPDGNEVLLGLGECGPPRAYRALDLGEAHPHCPLPGGPARAALSGAAARPGHAVREQGMAVCRVSARVIRARWQRRRPG